MVANGSQVAEGEQAESAERKVGSPHPDSPELANGKDRQEEGVEARLISAVFYHRPGFRWRNSPYGETEGHICILEIQYTHI